MGVRNFLNFAHYRLFLIFFFTYSQPHFTRTAEGGAAEMYVGPSLWSSAQGGPGTRGLQGTRLSLAASVASVLYFGRVSLTVVRSGGVQPLGDFPAVENMGEGTRADRFFEGPAGPAVSVQGVPGCLFPGSGGLLATLP